jgi:hypothetical protein
MDEGHVEAALASMFRTLDIAGFELPPTDALAATIINRPTAPGARRTLAEIEAERCYNVSHLSSGQRRGVVFPERTAAAAAARATFLTGMPMFQSARKSSTARLH